MQPRKEDLVKCINANKNFLILEEDCFTHRKIKQFIKENDQIVDSSDICFCLTTNSVKRINLRY